MKPKPESSGDTIKKANYANLLKKLKAGETLSTAQMAQMAEYDEEFGKSEKPKKHGKFMEQMRWTLPKAAHEFGVGRNTLVFHVKHAGIVPGSDGKFSTMDICKAIFGDRDKALLDQTNKENALLDIELSERRNEVIKVETVFRVWESVAMSIKRTILTSGLTTKEKDAILNELEGLKNEKYVEQRKFDEEGETTHPKIVECVEVQNQKAL